MAREPIAYRDNLEDLLHFFPDRRILFVQDVARYTGRDSRWCKKRYFANLDVKKGISIPTLARMLADGL